MQKKHLNKSKGVVTLSEICNSKYCASNCASDSQSREVQNKIES